VISSHVLRDVEKIVDYVICLDRGRVRHAAPLDELQERFSEWLVTSKSGKLPVYFPERYVLSPRGRASSPALVRDAGGASAEFRAAYDAEVTPRRSPRAALPASPGGEGLMRGGSGTAPRRPAMLFWLIHAGRQRADAGGVGGSGPRVPFR